MTEPTDYERGLRDGVEIGKQRRPGADPLDVMWWVVLLAIGGILGAVVAS